MNGPIVLGADGQFQLQPGLQLVTLNGTTVDKSNWVTLLDEESPLVIPSHTSWLFHAWILGCGVAGSGGFELSGVFRRNEIVNLLGTKDETIASDSSDMKVRAVADTVNNALSIQVKGMKSAIVNWQAIVSITSITP